MTFYCYLNLQDNIAYFLNRYNYMNLLAVLFVFSACSLVPESTISNFVLPKKIFLWAPMATFYGEWPMNHSNWLQTETRPLLKRRSRYAGRAKEHHKSMASFFESCRFQKTHLFEFKGSSRCQYAVHPLQDDRETVSYKPRHSSARPKAEDYGRGQTPHLTILR